MAPRTLVVQQLRNREQPAGDELRDDHRDHVVLPAIVELVEIGDDGTREIAVGRVHDLQGDVELEHSPIVLDRRVGVVFGDVDRGDVVRAQRLRVLQRRHYAAVHAPDEHDHRVVHRCRPDLGGLDAQARAKPRVVTFDGDEQPDDRRNNYKRHPGATREFGRGDDEQHDSGRHRADCVDEDAALPARQPQPSVVDHHPPLTEGEGGEDSHCVQRDQRVRDSPESHQERARGNRQEHDPVGEDEPIATIG